MRTDLQLVQGTLAGNERDAHELDSRWRPRLRVFVRRRIKDADTTEDIVQGTLVRAFTRLETFKQDASFGTWVFTIATNVMINEGRNRYNRRRTHGVDLDAVVDRRNSADHLVLQRETFERIDDALAKLQPEHRATLLLACDEDRSYKEIAEETGSNVGTIKSRLHRARLAFIANYLPPQATG